MQAFENMTASLFDRIREIKLLRQAEREEGDIESVLVRERQLAVMSYALNVLYDNEWVVMKHCPDITTITSTGCWFNMGEYHAKDKGYTDYCRICEDDSCPQDNKSCYIALKGLTYVYERRKQKWAE